jgi:hypothetical protein
MSNTYLQSAQDLLVIDIKVPVASGSPLQVDSLGTITAYDLSLDGLEFNTPGSLAVEVVDSSWALSAKDTVPAPASD